MAHRELTFLRQIKSINVRESKQWEISHNVSAKRVIQIKSLLFFIQKISKIGGKNQQLPTPPQPNKRQEFHFDGSPTILKKNI